MDPMLILRDATKRLPALKYAIGVTGIAAAAAIVMRVLGPEYSKVSGVLIGGTICAMFLLFAFSRLVTSAKSDAVTLPGFVMFYVVALAFCCFVAFTVSAFAFYWPEPWAVYLNVPAPSDKNRRARILSGTRILVTTGDQAAGPLVALLVNEHVTASKAPNFDPEREKDALRITCGSKIQPDQIEALIDFVLEADLPIHEVALDNRYGQDVLAIEHPLPIQNTLGIGLVARQPLPAEQLKSVSGCPKVPLIYYDVAL
ncbi:MULTISPECIES: hypothetical protein [Rhizobium/Agrobacterium group]|uniref:hypothetical protein n=1 Tax=Rhizobium/Agrobacterium group TaxID=227290 RepID=UPI0011135491|nr:MULTISPECIES: hypothetical protein [Rhizobium/Agrobacterium group]MCF1436770.1 hypothetical protein [Allorhizobium ampelinum]MCF1464928.1 hypothetical protein [Allorhizobium ampelinum]MCF1495965.1 hypothetical protein [Allorhizobium ampelinum]MUO92145.1 hypothetical protein [Agrobacterium vitis]MUZ55459.1 hypothetical protein [Agrobacterium vitis]